MTKKRIRLRSALIDILIVVICLGVCAGSIYLFWKDLNSSTVRTDKDSIATIVFKQKIAQRKFSDRVVWERLQNEAPLYNEDLLRTAAQSEAVITFNNNAVIELHENTMLQIFYSDDGGVTVNVDGGNIDIDTSSASADSDAPSISLQMGNGTKVNIGAGSKLTATSDSETGISSLDVKEGKASLTDKNGEETKIQHGESAKVENNGSVSKGKFTVTSISNNLRVLNFEEEKAVPVQLEWNASDELKEKPVIIETSRKKDFSVIENKYVVENENNFTLPADDGTLYWRVSVAAEEGETALDPVEGKIRVDNVDEIVSSSPLNGAVLSYRKELPKVQFAWKGNSLASSYLLEVSKTADFSDIFIKTEVETESAIFNNIGNGDYYWRVTPYYAINNTGYADASKVSGFSIIQNDELLPPALSVPAQNANLTYQAKDFNLTFLWKSDVRNADYKLIIAKDSSFTDIAYTATLKDKRVFRNFADELNVGQYYWKVIRNSSEDEGLAISEVRHFTINRYVPGENRLLYPPNNYSVELAKFNSTNFMWKLSDEYKSSSTESVFQVSKDSDFTSVLYEQKTKGTNVDKVNLRDGKYYWRIGVYNSFEDKIVYTIPRMFTVLNELNLPKNLIPGNGQTLVALKNSKLKLKWDSVSEADYYVVQVIDSKKGSVAYETKVTAASADDFILPETLSSDKTEFKFTVQAFTEQSDIAGVRQSQIASAVFAVRTPAPVKLVSPSNKTKIDGLQAFRKPVVLEWASGIDKASKATVVVKRISSSGAAKEIKRIENAKNQVSLERLPQGTYQWTVYASTADGLPVNAAGQNTFTVTPVPKLAAVNLSEPKQNFVIGPEYLRKNRSISFKWKAVSGATDYTFTLYQRNADGSIRTIYSEKKIKNTSVVLKNLKDFDVGNFEWNVTAYCHAKDGFEEQSSNTATGKFKIDFDLPETVKTNDPGRVYGN